jgi:hypothetical protein
MAMAFEGILQAKLNGIFQNKVERVRNIIDIRRDYVSKHNFVLMAKSPGTGL